MALFHLLILCFGLLGSYLGVAGKDCVMTDQCHCTFDDGSGTVDLTGLGSQDASNPLVRDSFAADNYAYSFNPCYPFTEGTCVNAAACQVDTSSSIYYNIGDSAKVTFSYDGLNVVGTYQSDDGQRTSVVTFVCDPTADSPSSVANGETSGSLQYTFTVTSKLACPTGGSGNPSGSVSVNASISVGSVLTILFFSVIIIYVVAGVSFLKFRRQETGRGLVPNSTFWSSVPGLIKDGCKFTVSKVTRKPMTYASI